MLIDYHIHSTFSNDSEAKLDDICQSALSQGLQEIAITDHVDYQYPIQPPDYAISDFDLYFKTLNFYQRKYQNRLTIRSGVEIGLNAERSQDYNALLGSYPFDFVIASLHNIQGFEPHLGTYYQRKSKEEAFRVYYQEILYLLNCYQNFNILGHLDYVKRYMPYPVEAEDHLLANDAVTQILQKLIAMGKGIEINTSGLKHISQATMPHLDIIRQYHQLGGTTLTIGSDSHLAQQVGFGVSATISALKEMGISTLSTFKQREEILIPL